jgi:hypothetical protein
VADKPEFVDMISAATRQTRRRVMARAVEPRGHGEIAPQPLATGSMGAVADGDAHAVEVQILEVQELGLGTATFTADRNSGARSIFRLSGNRLAARKCF